MPAPIVARRVIRVRLPSSTDWWADVEAMHRIDAAVRRHEGDDDLVLRVPLGGGAEVALRSRSRRVEWGPALADELRRIVGGDRIEVEEPASAPVLLAS